jgi:hypothetical protein
MVTKVTFQNNQLLAYTDISCIARALSPIKATASIISFSSFRNVYRVREFTTLNTRPTPAIILDLSFSA